MGDPIIDFPSFTLPSELFAVGNETRTADHGTDAWSATSQAVDDFNLDNFDTELNFGTDMDLDFEKLCREILDDTDGQVDPPGPESVESVETIATASSRSNSESEGSGTSEQEESPIYFQSSPVVEPSSEPIFLGNAVRARVVRFASNTAIPIVVGRQGLVRDPAKTRICFIRRPSSDGNLGNGSLLPTVSTIQTTAVNSIVPSSSRLVSSTRSFEGFILNPSTLADDCSVATDVSSPLSSDDPEEEHDDANEPVPLILTDEEKKLMVQERIVLPDHYPLTREEERNLRSIRRKIRNKKSAENSRKRKQKYVADLEKRVKVCSEEKAMLQKRVSKLETENASLLSQLRNVQTTMAGLAGKAAPTSTAFLILVMSVAMLLAPNVKFSSKVSTLDKMLETPDSVLDSQLVDSGTSAAKRTLLADTRNIEPTISSDTNKLEELFKNLEAMKKQFSWAGETFSPVSGGESPAKRRKRDDPMEDIPGSSRMEGSAGNAATLLDGKEGRVSVTTLLEPDGFEGTNTVYLATNQTKPKIEALEY